MPVCASLATDQLSEIWVALRAVPLKFPGAVGGVPSRVRAEAALLESHAILVAAIGEDHEQTGKAVRALVELYDGWGKPERAGEWRARLPADRPAS